MQRSGHHGALGAPLRSCRVESSRTANARSRSALKPLLQVPACFTALSCPGLPFGTAQWSVMLALRAARPCFRHSQLLRSGLLTCTVPRTPSGALYVRGYAHSRFERSRPGVGRERPKVTPSQRPTSEPQHSEESQMSYESQPSVADSSLWEQSALPIARDPEEGLKRLLMSNDRLVVTRCVSSH